MIGLLRIVAGLVLALTLSLSEPTPAKAQSCTFSMPSFDFGNIDLTQNTTFDLVGTLSVTCTGNSGATIRYCPNINAGSGGSAPGGDPRYMLNGPIQLAYNIYKDAGFTQVWGSYTSNFTPPVGTLTLNSSGFGSGSLPVRVRINAGQTGLPTGLYMSTFTGVQTSFAYSYPFFGIALCPIFTGINAVQVPFTVQANNTGTCSVTASDLNFGNIGLLTSSIDAASTLNINCTSGLTYQVTLSGGLTAAADPTQRKMVAGLNHITYGLYQNAARTTPWGETFGSNTLSGIGTGTNQSIGVFGRIPPQTTPQPSTYSDTIVATVSY